MNKHLDNLRQNYSQFREDHFALHLGLVVAIGSFMGAWLGSMIFL